MASIEDDVRHLLLLVRQQKQKLAVVVVSDITGGKGERGGGGGGGAAYGVRSEGRRGSGRRGGEVFGERERGGSDELSELFLETEGTDPTWVLCEGMVYALHPITHVLILCFHH